MRFARLVKLVSAGVLTVGLEGVEGWGMWQENDGAHELNTAQGNRGLTAILFYKCTEQCIKPHQF